MEVLANSMVVIILQHTNVSNQHMYSLILILCQLQLNKGEEERNVFKILDVVSITTQWTIHFSISCISSIFIMIWQIRVGKAIYLKCYVNKSGMRVIRVQSLRDLIMEKVSNLDRSWGSLHITNLLIYLKIFIVTILFKSPSIM